MTTLGRPMKGTTRRIPYTIHIAQGTMDVIDEYIEDRSREEQRAYSRSDFINKASESLLRNLGRLPKEAENEARIFSRNEKKR